MSEPILRAAQASPLLRDLNVVWRPLTNLRPYERNPRTHSKKQIRQIAESIKVFGFTNPIITDDDDGVLAGHGRIAAAKLLALTEVPTIRLSAMTEVQKRAYILADNKLAENAGWDEELLGIELQQLAEIDLEFELTVTGFAVSEIDLLIEGLDATSADKSDQIPSISANAPVTRLGDLWTLGRHRLFCGDATNAVSYDTLMDFYVAQAIFTDPPFNVPIQGHVSGLGNIKHDEFAMASGEMTEAEFTAFLKTVFGHLVSHSANGSIHFVCMDWRHCYELLTAARGTYTDLKNLCVWNKTNGGMGSLYRSKHELVFVLKKGSVAHINNVELGANGRYRTNVWDYAGINALSQGRAEELAMHPTVKPVALVSDAILDVSKRGAIVLDPFLGSGSTLIAAERTGRRCFGMELEPKYVDVALERFVRMTGEKPVLESTRESFDEIKARRLSEKDGADVV
jgi:DNA modification methylase